MRFIVSKRPKEYLKQGPTGCGAFSVKGILSAYGKDDKTNPFEYYPPSIVPFIAPLGTWVKILNAYGMNAKLQFMQGLCDTQRLNTLKELIRNDTPVMLCIGNGYRGNGIWSKIRWRLISHWITLWGFDDEQGIFYIYDSAVPFQYRTKNIPTGNITRTYAQVLRDYGGGQPWQWRHAYITISPRS